MAVNDSNVIGIRQELNAKGIDNSRIGYNKQTGYVTIDGQNFLQPVSSKNGMSFADPTTFGNAYGVFDTGVKTKAATDSYLGAVNTPYDNPMDTKINDILGQITAAMNPGAYDVYSSPEYAAQQAAAGRAAQQGIRSAQESMGASGFGRSTNLADRAQGIQNDSNEYLQTQVIPQLQASHRAEEQQKLSSLMGFLNALSGQQGVYDNRHNSEVDQLGQTLDFLTGRSDRAQDVQYKTVRDRVADMQYEEQVKYTKERDKIGDEKDKRAFDENVRQFGLNYALNAAQLAQSKANASADNQLARDRLEWEKDPSNPDNVYKAKQIDALQKEIDGAGSEPLKDELEGIYTGLSRGELTVTQALDEINSRERSGLTTPQDAVKMRSFVQKYMEGGNLNAPNKPQVVDSKLLTMTGDQLAEAWKTDPSGKKAGRSRNEWRSWITDPNGYKSGLTYELWKEKYGPRLGG